MTEAEAVERMIPPGRHRPTKLHNGIVQIHITRACTQACYNCTQGSNLGGRLTFISLENFEKAVVSLVDYFGLVALFGGQPTLHPEFPELCRILSTHIPKNRRGLWTNALNGHGAICRETFCPQNCNLNVHLSRKDYDEFKSTWPESQPFGLREDSRHSPPYVAMMDVIPDESERWKLISTCDVNHLWSSMLCEVCGELRAYFCELAGAQALLHQDDPSWPDTGLPVEPGWWKRPMQDFKEQVRWHCHRCGIPLRGYGELAQAEDGLEQVSEVHKDIYRPKRKGRKLEVVAERMQLGIGRINRATDYLQNARK